MCSPAESVPAASLYDRFLSSYTCTKRWKTIEVVGCKSAPVLSQEKGGLV